MSAPITHGDPWLSVREAARVLGCSPQTVLKRAAQGEFKTTSASGRVLIDREGVENAAAAA